MIERRDALCLKHFPSLQLKALWVTLNEDGYFMTGVVCLKLPGERVHRLSLIYAFLFPHSGLRKEKADIRFATPARVLQRPTSAEALLSTCLNERPPAARGCLKKKILL